mmetsp:Transcript_172930/g.554519  ORF Transcript_172930/g.554519 Transcript_172930/m.554519 type:complete len:207 (-) Transcript_172930:606-1226(-)
MRADCSDPNPTTTAFRAVTAEACEARRHGLGQGRRPGVEEGHQVVRINDVAENCQDADLDGVLLHLLDHQAQGRWQRPPKAAQHPLLEVLELPRSALELAQTRAVDEQPDVHHRRHGAPFRLDQRRRTLHLRQRRVRACRPRARAPGVDDVADTSGLRRNGSAAQRCGNLDRPEFSKARWARLQVARHPPKIILRCTAVQHAGGRL